MTDRDPSTWTPEEIRRINKPLIEAERREYGPDPEPEADQPKHGFSSKWVMACLHENEDGDARLYVELHRGRFVYDTAAGVWDRWTGNYWKDDLLDEATEAVEKVIEVYSLEVERQAWQRLQSEKSGQPERAKNHASNEDALLKRIRVLQTLSRKKSIVELARTGKNSLAIDGTQFDRDGWLLGCLNGVLELRTGTFRPGRPEDFIKTVAPVLWLGPDTPAPVLERFLLEVFDGTGKWFPSFNGF